MKKIWTTIIAMCFVLALSFACAHKTPVPNDASSDHYSLDFGKTAYSIPKEIPDFREWQGEISLLYDSNEVNFRVVSWMGCNSDPNLHDCVGMIIVGQNVPDENPKSGIVIILYSNGGNKICSIDDSFFQTGVVSHILSITNHCPTMNDILKHEKDSRLRYQISFRPEP